MTEPTDKELEAFAVEEQFLLFCDVDEFTQIARAVLAKWGTPPAVAGEPVAWWIPKAEQFCLADKSGDRPFAKAWEPLYTTPHPTQAVPPAGREPLTEEQRSDIATAAAGFNWADDYVEAIEYVIDGVESLHGIKGGLHGAK